MSTTTAPSTSTTEEADCGSYDVADSEEDCGSYDVAGESGDEGQDTGAQTSTGTYQQNTGTESPQNTEYQQNTGY
ncbi:unnamed protein product [Phytophthora lilii]|uniref:Unnamed protein product n=1 Tax=Phytophthora lilii TaxID=2077276 RepID=A0A9W6YLE2_9STRA|nr:unnamed protein product [Phytophthora lilii]